MKYNQLNIKANKSGRRVGRGIAAGQGKTAGRGTKGQGSRTGSTKRPGFEGGQNPLMQKLPKLPGFHSHFVKAENITVGDLEQFAGKSVDAEMLASNGLVSSPYARIKLLSGGELTKKVTVRLPAASKTAIAAIESVGGVFEITPRMQRPVTSTKNLNKEEK